MSTPIISIIVPVYNVEKYLHRCIDSILAQTFADFELILVDDGSPDGCPGICDDYAQKDSRVRVIHKENGGVSSARNAGIEMAVGEYIMFVDSDDYIDSDMLKTMWEQCGSSDIVFTGLKFVNLDGTILRTHTIEPFDKISKNEFIQKHLISAMSNYITSGPYNKFYKTSIIKSNHIRFNNTLSICEDGLFVFEYMAKCSTFTCIQKAFYNYIQYPAGNLMSKYNENSIYACEQLYHAEMAFLGKVQCSEQIKKYIEIGTVQRFVSFYLYIYTRSSLTDHSKYLKAKESWQNISFRVLLRKYRCKYKRVAILYYSHKFKIDKILHQLLLFKYKEY